MCAFLTLIFFNNLRGEMKFATQLQINVPYRYGTQEIVRSKLRMHNHRAGRYVKILSQHNSREGVRQKILRFIRIDGAIYPWYRIKKFIVQFNIRRRILIGVSTSIVQNRRK